MAMTPAGSDAAYATPADYLLRNDARSTGMLVRDDGTEASAADLQADPVLAALLLAASGAVEAACLAGGRYAAEDLRAATGASRAYLQGLVCDLATGLLYDRRGGPPPDYLRERVEAARRTLAELEAGRQIFAFREAVAAGTARDRFERADQLSRLNLLTGFRRFFGTTLSRSDRF